jgi:hypothetical protein
MVKPIKQHLKKHRKAYSSYARWEFRSYWFMVDCSKLFIRWSVNYDTNIWK